MDYSCTKTALSVLSELFDLKIGQRAAQRVANQSNAQCGLFEGIKVFLLFYCSCQEIKSDKATELCLDLLRTFEKQFGKLTCGALVEKYGDIEAKGHICEKLTADVLYEAYEFINKACLGDKTVPSG
jgi:hypothetical protein